VCGYIVPLQKLIANGLAYYVNIFVRVKINITLVPDIYNGPAAFFSAETNSIPGRGIDSGNKKEH
jgi:hypothetical protein